MKNPRISLASSKTFSLTFDGRKKVISKEEFQVDEALIDEVTDLPRIGENWFKTTVTKNVKVRSYLKPEHKNIVWKKSIPTSWLEEKWFKFNFILHNL